MDTNTIGYVKMYSTFRDKTTENCFAFVLMPYSPQKQRVSLHSIQFDFNAQGDIPVLSIFYDGREKDIQRKAQETIEAIDKLKANYGQGKECCVFNRHNNSRCEPWRAEGAGE